MTKVDHGFVLEAIQRELEASDWENDPEEGEGREVRRVFLGSIQGLTPSGKIYAPWACSNVMGCNTCNGTGKVIPRSLKVRTGKRRASRHARIMRRWQARYGASTGLYGRLLSSFESRAVAWLKSQPKAFRLRYFSNGHSCFACGGMGSREAHLDELWHEACELAFGSIGVSFEQDSGDYFAVDRRERPETGE